MTYTGLENDAAGFFKVTVTPYPSGAPELTSVFYVVRIVHNFVFVFSFICIWFMFRDVPVS